MKISPKKYAIALYDVANKADKIEQGLIAEKFFKLLLKKNSFSLLPLVIEELEKYADQQRGQVRAELFTAHQASRTLVNELRKFLADRLQEKIILQEHVDKDLLGGFALKWNDFLLDVSVKAELSRLNRQLNS
ncbi:MAG: F0F1 ATP synthase subunit delta [Candidatus Gribaldobacteria bacterium]|nr:F0F1 ATP synthase subunit delta [Candidatus Gribaldobacteria bacterium]